jgi:TetR/AcrR family transcriptional regulator
MAKSFDHLPLAGGRDSRTEQRILDAAHEVFVRRGTAGARMKEIADAAGVNQALLHYYFRSKDRLAQAVFQRAARQLLPRVVELLSSDAPIEEKVEQVIRTELEHLARTPFLPGYLIGELNHDPDRASQLIQAITGLETARLAPPVLRRLERQIDERVRAGAMRPIAAEQFIINLISLCIFPFAARPMLMALLGLDDKGFQRLIARRKRELTAFFLNALRP